jgi:hypothetical protein
LPRVAIEGYPDTNIKSMAAVPERMTVKIGDLVEVNTRYRDASLPCHFIPWLINRPVDANQVPAAASAARSPPKLELTRFVVGGQKLRLEFLVAIEPDCSSMGQTAVRVLEQPTHGTLTVENGQGFTNFAKDNQRYECNTRRSDGTLVFYEPKPDYAGADSISLYVIALFDRCEIAALRREGCQRSSASPIRQPDRRMGRPYGPAYSFPR